MLNFIGFKSKILNKRKLIIDLLPSIAAISLALRGFSRLYLYISICSSLIVLLNFFYVNKWINIKSVFFKFLKQGVLIIALCVYYIVLLVKAKIALTYLNDEYFRIISALCVYVILIISQNDIGFKELKKNIVISYLILFSPVILILIILGVNHFGVDYNMLALYLIIEFILINNIYSKGNNRNLCWLGLNLFNILVLIMLILLQSRRGLIVFSSVTIIAFTYSLFKKKYFQFFKRHSIVFVFSFLVFFFSFIILTNYNRAFYFKQLINDESFIDRINFQDGLKFFDNKSILDNEFKKCAFNELKNDTLPTIAFYKKYANLSLFCNSKNELDKLINQGIVIPDTLFSEEYVFSLPYILNIDFYDNNMFYPIEYDNCYLNEFNTSDTLSYFNITSSSSDKSYVMTTLPICDSSEYIISFYLKNNQSIPIIRFTKVDSLLACFDNIQTHKFNDSLTFVTAKFSVLKTKADFIKVYFDFNEPIVLMSQWSWYRKQLSSKALQITDQSSWFLKEKFNQLNSFINIKNLSSQDSIINITDSRNEFNNYNRLQRFEEYANCTINTLKLNKVEISAKEKGAFYCFKRLIILPRSKYVVHFISNVKPVDLIFYPKRYPENNNEFLAISSRKINNKELTDSLFYYSDTFNVQNSSSLMVIYKIGSMANNSFYIQNFQIEDLSDTSSILLTQKQLTYFDNIKKVATESDNVLFDKKDNIAERYNLLKPVLNNKLASSRSQRWIISYQYYSSLSWQEKVFGDGFVYLKVFAKLFWFPGLQEKDYDYPHNPIISSFLFSGLIGGVFYLVFISIILFRFIRDRKAMGLLFVLFIISLFFSFFSGNSHFSIPIFTIFSFFPFIKSIHRT